MRPYLNLVHKAGEFQGVLFDEIVPNFIYRVSYHEDSFIMYDVDLGMNNSSSVNLALSKSATYETLTFFNVSAIKHIFLLNPESPHSSEDVYEKAENAFFSFNNRVVIKPDDGAKGINVLKIEDQDELQFTLKQLFHKDMDIAISPYCKGQVEYRTVVLNGKSMISFAKVKRSGWKHTLSNNKGEVEIRELDFISEEKKSQIYDFAIKSAQALGLSFCTVDILETESGLFVLEVNASVFLSEYVKKNDQSRDKVLELYKEAFWYKFKMREGKRE